MNENDKKAVIETAKSIGRMVWFGLLGVLVTALSALATGGFGHTIGVVVLGQYMDINIFVMLFATAMVKLLDKYIHEHADIPSKGIAPSILQK